ncbi:MAG: extracellular solute-binding protein, partial [Myxococcota bacterium]|nr:extracellular solute-binding protein [Myxococcota bacterium]
MNLLFLIACGATEEATPEVTSPKEEPVTQSLRIYSGRGESLVGELFKEAEKDLNLKIEVQYGKTNEMVTRILTEGEQSPADIIFAQDSGHLGALSNQNILAELPDELFADIHQQFKDDANRWIGTSGRLRVLVYDSKRLKPEELPQGLKDLADPKWKGRIGWAPTNGSFLSHVSALRHIWGEAETEAWLKGVQANEPQVHPKNSPQVKAVDEGTLEIGWVNHYYLHRLKKESNAKNYSFPTAKDPGNILMLAGAGIRKGSPNQKQAQILLKWLVSPK